MSKTIEALAKIFSPDETIFGANMTNNLPLESYFGALSPAISKSEFFSINPLTIVDPEGSPRKGINVATFRNFMFESDADSLEFQLLAWKMVAKELPIAMLTYSGSKSYHAIISLIDTPPWKPHTEAGVMAYRRAWKGLAKRINQIAPELELDMATKDPSRLSRTPFATRTSTGALQETISDPAFGRFISSEEVLQLETQLPPEMHVSAVGANVQVKSLSHFEAMMGKPELSALRYKLYEAPQSWASAQSMYPMLFRYTCWAIDATNVPAGIFLEYLRKYTFPVILGKGYQRDLSKPVTNAYEYKQP